ncbi:hypothetical protein GGD65_004018 [Bradyrhizobium sp. CIR18]|uniref:hypothetical protein n=1 Tax=Bradyrhizobium sp. CIR18 TaxID=2663839 RepID=UPI00160591E3|nr:hypothetical protein [Bradyrhizobium sp. CIR18]MBB4362985.1 hypothetical protein [Bradyrhizobium sp. CIR18]
MAIVIERPFLGSAFLPNNRIRGLATSRPSFGEQFDVCHSYHRYHPTPRARREIEADPRVFTALRSCAFAQFLRSTGLIGARRKTENRSS